MTLFLARSVLPANKPQEFYNRIWFFTGYASWYRCTTNTTLDGDKNVERSAFASMREEDISTTQAMSTNPKPDSSIISDGTRG